MTALAFLPTSYFAQNNTRISAVEAALPWKSDIGHGHAIGDVSGLTSALSAKASASDVATSLASEATTRANADTALGNRVGVFETQFAAAKRAAFFANLEENAGALGVTVLGVSVGTATAQATQNVAINKMKKCLVDNGLMAAA